MVEGQIEIYIGLALIGAGAIYTAAKIIGAIVGATKQSQSGGVPYSNPQIIQVQEVCQGGCSGGAFARRHAAKQAQMEVEDRLTRAVRRGEITLPDQPISVPNWPTRKPADHE